MLTRLCLFCQMQVVAFVLADLVLLLVHLLGYLVLVLVCFFSVIGFLKQCVKKRRKHRELVLQAKNKLNSIEIIISKALTDADICHEEFALVSNEAEFYGRLKESLRITNSESVDIEKYRLIEHVKTIGNDEIMKLNERIKFDLSYFFGKSYFNDYGSQII